MRRVFLLGLCASALAASAFRGDPQAVDRRLNRVRGTRTEPSRRARALAARMQIVDLHADTLLWGRDIVKRHEFGHVDLPRLIEGGVAIQTFAAATKMPARARNGLHVGPDRVLDLIEAQGWPRATSTSMRERSFFLSRRLETAAVASNGRLALIRNREDLARLLAARGRGESIVGALMSIEGAQALESGAGDLEAIYSAGFRMIGLAHFFDNAFAGSAHGAHRHGLTAEGRRLVRAMEEKGVIVDLAHASPRTIADVVTMARRPVVASHTGVRGTCDTPRNLSDEDLRGIARTGGVIGIGFFRQAVCGRDVDAIVRAMSHAVRVVGVDHVALGSDFDGAVTTPFDAAGVAALADGLLAHGFSADEIGKIMGGNALRVLRAALPEK
ncbi:MAG: dipeptidase [Vicinamibacteria bacterium]|nr:dipeptidase [Vicinamibacteria bacterium]